MKYIVLLLLLFHNSLSYSQNNKIHGIILNNESQPIDNTIIGYRESTLSTNSNQEGRFEIPISLYKNDTLLINKIGYETEKIAVSTIKNPVDITLVNKYKTIQEIVVTPLKVQAILDSIVANIHKNYEENIFYTGICKEGNFNKNKLTKYSQSVLQFESNKDKKNKLYIEDHNSFKKQDSSTTFFNFILFNLLKDGIEITKLINLFKNSLSKYSYIKAYKNNFGEQPVIEVLLKEQESDNSYRKIIINVDNYAVLQFSNHLNITNKISTNKGYYFQETSSLQIDYRPSNGKYILNKINSEFTGYYSNNSISTPIKSYMEFHVADYCISGCNILKKEINLKKSVYEQINKNNKIIPNNNIQNKVEYEYLKQ